MNLWFVLGTAAELIKMYPLIRQAQERGWRPRVVSTGQSGQNFWMQYAEFALADELAVRLLDSDKDLESSSSALKWFARAACVSRQRLRAKIAVDLRQRNFLLVHGDTLSSLVGASYGFRLRLPVVHVEAGLRSESLWQPFPEEICRRVVSKFARVHMAPDEQAASHLQSAGVRGKVVVTYGNSLMDAIRYLAPAPGKVRARPLALANLHRYENLNSQERWRKIIATLLAASRSHQVVMVLHPQTRYKLSQSPQDEQKLNSAGIEMVDRLSFSKFIELLYESDFLISDGGSNQEECFYMGKPCLLLRDTTERQEGLTSTCLLSRFDDRLIEEFLKKPDQFRHEPHRQEKSPTAEMLNSLADLTSQMEVK